MKEGCRSKGKKWSECILEYISLLYLSKDSVRINSRIYSTCIRTTSTNPFFSDHPRAASPYSNFMRYLIIPALKTSATRSFILNVGWIFFIVNIPSNHSMGRSRNDSSCEAVASGSGEGQETA